MVRKLAIAAFTVSALSAGVAKALGLGEANVESALNQPLSAEIELVNVRDLEQNEILTNLASREEFLRAGVDRVFFLSDLRFSVEEKGDGKTVIKVTSSKAVREPFINFLVEVTWPTGRLLREYALLIDPPTFSSESAQPVQLSQAPAQTQQPASVQQAPAQQSQPRATSAPAATTSQPSTRGDSYGPTGGDDTLWSIAMKTRLDKGISPQQQMLAIQDLNPDAFFDGNINRLKAGQILRLPSKEQSESRTTREAIAAVSVQNRSFAEQSSARSRGLDATSPTTEISTATAGTSRDELRVIVANTDEGSTDAAASGSTTGGGGTGTATSQELLVTKERLDKTARENEELKSRLEDLEGQLDTLQRLISLKDDQLAAMQGEASIQGEASMQEVTQEAPGEMPSEMTSEQAPTEMASEEAEPVTEETMPGSAMGEPTAETQAVESAPAEPVQPDVVEEKPVVEPKPVEPVVQDESIVDMIKNNVVYQIALGAGGVILLLILWLLSRSKTRKEEAYHEDAEVMDDNDTIITFDDAEDQEDSAIPGAEGVGSDPVAEADVYIAYQKYDQAAQVLEAALEDEPENHAYRLKLLEVAGEAKDGAKFASVLAALEASGDADILERASEVKERFGDLSDEPEVSLDDLESQLMGGDTFASDDDIAESDISEDFELDVDINDAEEVEDTVIKSEAQAEFVQEENFDLDEESTVASEDNLDIEFDLSDIDLDEGLGEETIIQGSGEPATTSDEDLVSLDFDLDSTLESEEELDVEMEDDFSAELDDEPGGVLEEKPVDAEGVGEEETLAFSEDFDLGETAKEESAELDLDSDFSDELLDIDAPATPTADTPVQAAETEEELNLDLEDSDIDFSLDEKPSLAMDTEEESELSADDFSLDTLEDADLDLEISEVAGDLAESETEEEVNELAEDLAEEFVQEVDTLEDDNLELDTDLGDLETNLDELAAEPDEAEAELGVDEEVVSAPASTSGTTDEFVTEMEEDFDFLSDTDESATKLDLARAYIDMGDKEGARDILEEVVEEGSSEQKDEASELLKGLD